MKTFHACLMAEFHRALKFLPWLLGLHALTFGARTRWAGEFSNQLVGMIEWTSWALAALVAVISLWHDAPLRRERFLSTRPLRFLPMLAAKWIALLLIVPLPFGFVEFMALETGGIRGGFLFLGTLQSGLFFLAALAVLFPAVWWWRTPTAAFTALGVTFIALVTNGFLLSRQLGNRNPYSGESHGFPLDPMLALGFMVALAGVATVLLPLVRKFREMVRIPVFAAIACLSLWIGLRVSTRPPEADKSEAPSIVSVYGGKSGYPATKHGTFSAAVPPTPTEPDIEVAWSFSKLTIDGRDSRPWSRNSPSDASGTLPFRSALVRTLGSKFDSPDAGPPDRQPTLAILADGASSPSNHEIAFEMLESHCRWEVVVDIPLKEGASAQLPDCRWNISTYRPEHAIQLTEKYRVEFVLVEFSKFSANLWLFSEPKENSNRWSDEDLPCIVDPVDGTVHPITFNKQEFSVGSATNQIRRLMSWDTGSSLRHAITNSPRELRFVVLRPKVVRRIAHPWKSPGLVDLTTHSNSFRSEPVNDTLKGINLMAWLDSNPVPSSDASSTDVESWFSDFHPRLLANDDQVRDRNNFGRMLEILAPFVKNHPDVALEATEKFWQLPWLLESAILKNLPRDTVKRFPKYALSRALTEAYVKNGWAGDLAAIARDKARNGLAWKVRPILLAVPEEVGLTETEWLDYFHLDPSAEVYKALVGKGLFQEQMDKATDELLMNFRGQPVNKLNSQRLDLALARGRKEAPRWLKEAYESQIASSKGEYISSAVFDRLIDTYFHPPKIELPNNPFGSRAKKVEWFLSIDPERFVFDPATRTYQLRNNP